MNDCIKLVFSKQTLQSRAVSHISFDKVNTAACNLLQARQHLATGIDKIVQNDDFMARLKQGNDCMRADVARAAPGG